MHICKFLLMAHLMDISRSPLEQLEEFDACLQCHLQTTEHGEVSDAPQLVGSIREAALRAKPIREVTILPNAVSESEEHKYRNIPNLSKIWDTLERLQSSLSLMFPDVLPAPPNVLQCHTGTSRRSPNPRQESPPHSLSPWLACSSRPHRACHTCHARTAPCAGGARAHRGGEREIQGEQGGNSRKGLVEGHPRGAARRARCGRGHACGRARAMLCPTKLVLQYISILWSPQQTSSVDQRFWNW